jgi:hypothetical protein
MQMLGSKNSPTNQTGSSSPGQNNQPPVMPKPSKIETYPSNGISKNIDDDIPF